MVKWLSILAIIGAALLLFSAPWVAGLAYTTVSLMQPQYIWFWSFEDFPLFKLTAGLAIIAWCIQALRGHIRWEVYREGMVVAIVLLWLIFQLSGLFAPFDDSFAAVKAHVVTGTLNSIVIMFLVIIGLINNEKVLERFAWVIIITGLYYTWWANAAYLGNEWDKFQGGRLNGPQRSPYADGNNFSILFVVCMPFMLFGLFHFRSKVVRMGLLFALPLLWHALVLCASRGALISIAVSTLLAAFMLKSRLLNMALIAGFVVFLVYQGGPLINRSVDTVQDSREQREGPINPRIVSWQVGIDLIKQYPVLGVGPQRFRTASFTLYPGRSPHVAHSTLLNFAANTGIFAAAIYLYFFFAAYKMYRYGRQFSPPGSAHHYLSQSCTCALAGFFVGAIFLDLIIFEPFYFLLVMCCANHHLLKQKVAPSTATYPAAVAHDL